MVFAIKISALKWPHAWTSSGVALARARARSVTHVLRDKRAPPEEPQDTSFTIGVHDGGFGVNMSNIEHIFMRRAVARARAECDAHIARRCITAC